MIQSITSVCRVFFSSIDVARRCSSEYAVHPSTSRQSHSYFLHSAQSKSITDLFSFKTMCCQKQFVCLRCCCNSTFPSVTVGDYTGSRRAKLVGKDPRKPLPADHKSVPTYTPPTPPFLGRAMFSSRQVTLSFVLRCVSRMSRTSHNIFHLPGSEGFIP